MQITINATHFNEIIIIITIKHHGLPKFIVTNRRVIFTSEF